MGHSEEHSALNQVGNSTKPHERHPNMALPNEPGQTVNNGLQNNRATPGDTLSRASDSKNSMTGHLNQRKHKRILSNVTERTENGSSSIDDQIHTPARLSRPTNLNGTRPKSSYHNETMNSMAHALRGRDRSLSDIPALRLDMPNAGKNRDAENTIRTFENSPRSANSFAAPTTSSKAKQTGKVELNPPRSAPLPYAFPNQNLQRSYSLKARGEYNIGDATNDQHFDPDNMRHRKGSLKHNGFTRRDKGSPICLTPDMSPVRASVAEQPHAAEVSRSVVEWLGTSSVSATRLAEKESDLKPVAGELQSIECPQEEAKTTDQHPNAAAVDAGKDSKPNRISSSKISSELQPAEKHSGVNHDADVSTQGSARQTSEVLTKPEIKQGTSGAKASSNQKVEQNLNESDEPNEAIRTHIRHITNAVEHMSQTPRNKCRGVETSEATAQGLGPECGTSALQEELLLLTKRFETYAQMMAAKDKEQLQNLIKKDHVIKDYKRCLEEATASTPKETPLDPAERDSWQALWKQSQWQLKQKEKQFEDFKAQTFKLYRPDLEKTIRELNVDLNYANDEKAALQEQLTQCKHRAKNWETEYQTLKIESEKRTEAFESTIKQQHEEMLLYIQKYHTKLTDPKYWSLSSLHQEIATLEHDLQTTQEMFDVIKTDKARAEEDNEKIYKAYTHLEHEFNSFTTIGAPPPIPTTFPFPHMPTSNNSGSVHPKRPHIARCFLPLSIAQRKVKLDELRREQAKRREKELAEAKVMEEARKWALKDKYPPGKPGWKEVLSEPGWKRWDVEAWRDQADGVTEEVAEVVGDMVGMKEGR